jgi:hypothetical protein
MRTRPGLLGALLRSGCLVLAVSCGGEDPPADRTPVEAGGEIFLDGGILDDGGTPPACPEGQPKVGETCGPGVTESTTCEFVIGECKAPNGVNYTESNTYCCLLGVWEICGSRSPCDAFDAALPMPDALAPDAAVSPADAGVDAAVPTPDAAAASADLAEDAEPDTALPDAASTD